MIYIFLYLLIGLLLSLGTDNVKDGLFVVVLWPLELSLHTSGKVKYAIYAVNLDGVGHYVTYKTTYVEAKTIADRLVNEHGFLSATVESVTNDNVRKLLVSFSQRL